MPERPNVRRLKDNQIAFAPLFEKEIPPVLKTLSLYNK